MRTFTHAALVCLLVGAGCGPKVVAPKPEGPAGHREKSMGNCPSAVVGAVTRVRELGDGVLLDITADDGAASADIFARAQLHATMGAPDPAVPVHTGQHGGPGDSGHCPIIHLGTTVTVEQILGGARITVLATDPAAAHQLQRETRARLAYFEPTTPAP